MRAYYAQRAPVYDEVYRSPDRAADLARLSRELPAQFAGRAVLEVACGTGFWTQFIAPAVPVMLATDGVAEPLALARQRPGTAHVVFEQADAYALPQGRGPRAGRFDAAFAGLWFSHVLREDRARFLNGLHECLAPGARVVLIDNHERQCETHPIAETDAAGNTFQHRPLADGSVHRVLKNFPSEAELRALLTPMARDIHHQRLDHFWCLSYVLGAPG